MEIYLSLPNWVDEWLLNNVIRPIQNQMSIKFYIYCTIPIAEPIDAEEIVTIERVSHVNGNNTLATALEMEKNYQMIRRAEKIIIFYSIHYRFDARISDIINYCKSIKKSYELHGMGGLIKTDVVFVDKTAVFGPKDWGTKEEMNKFLFIFDDLTEL